MSFIKIEEASKLLNVTNSTLLRWVRQGVVSTYHVNNENVIEKSELLKWAKKSKIEVHEDLNLADSFIINDDNQFDEKSIVTKALEKGIYKRISSKLSMEDIYKKAIELTVFQNNLNLDKDRLLKKFLDREVDLPTIIGNNIAIPHPKRSSECKFKKSIISIIVLDHPIFLTGDSDDNNTTSNNSSVDFLFFLFSKDSLSHLKLLGKIAKLVSLRKDFKNQIMNDKKITKKELLQLLDKEEILLK